MAAVFAAIPLLFAENAPAANPNAGTGTSPTIFLYIAVIGLWGYFLLFRPQQQQEKKRRAMIAALKKNDKVLTAAGIYGTVVSVDNDQDKVVLRVDDDKNIRLAFSKGAVTKVMEVSQEKTADPT